jgi:Flp pilus assembly protein TadG
MSGGSRARTGTVVQKLKRFYGDSSGNVSMFFGLAAIPLLVAVGAGLDTARINREHTTFNAAVDTAAIAVAADTRSSSATNTDALKELAKKVIASNYSPEQQLEGDVTVNVTITGSDIKVDANLDFPTAIMKLFGTDYINLKSSSTVTKAMRPIEIVLVMDTTGSMGSSVNGNTKLFWAKQAARDLLAKIYGGSVASQPRSEYLRVGLVPFAGAVKLNTAQAGVLSWVDTTGANPLSTLNFQGSTLNNYTAWSRLRNSSGSTVPWNGCIETRARGNPALNTDYNTNDVAPTSSNSATLFPAYFAPDTPSILNDTSNTSNNYNTASPSNTRWAGVTFYNSYIPESSSSTAASTAVPTSGETSGLTQTQRRELNATGLLRRLRNGAKYSNPLTVSGSESSQSAGPWAGCPATSISPLTYDRATIESAVNAMTARGPTNIAEGLAWGMRVLSPGEPYSQVSGSGSIASAPIASYNNPRWQKIMLLMTDGDNDLGPGSDAFMNRSSSCGNTTSRNSQCQSIASGGTTTAMNATANAVASIAYSAYGYPQATTNRFNTTDVYAAETSLNQAVLDICARIKSDKGTLDKSDDNVTLYVTSFGNGVSTDTRNMLRDCATTKGPGDPDYYTHSVTGADLSAFFDHVGEDVLNKMVYVSK